MLRGGEKWNGLTEACHEEGDQRVALDNVRHDRRHALRGRPHHRWGPATGGAAVGHLRDSVTYCTGLLSTVVDTLRRMDKKTHGKGVNSHATGSAKQESSKTGETDAGRLKARPLSFGVTLNEVGHLGYLMGCQLRKSHAASSHRHGSMRNSVAPTIRDGFKFYITQVKTMFSQ